MSSAMKHQAPIDQIPDSRFQIPDPPARPQGMSSGIRLLASGNWHLATGIWYLASGISSVLVILVCALTMATTVAALEVPYLAGRVNDQANLLDSAFEDGLEERLRLLEEETGAQVAVLTIPSLEGDPLEDFSMRVVETWKLGRTGIDDGVLVLIARDDRRMRIEVGYGLEPVLTDAQAGRIIDRLMAPRFREGDFDGGVDAAVEAIEAAIRGEPLPLSEKPAGSGGFDPSVILFVLLFGLPFINGALAARGATGWILGFFLTPFFFAFPAALFGFKAGALVAVAWLVIFPLLRLILPKTPPGGGAGSRRGSFWGPFMMGGGGGGFSGGGFSGGGGSFGGGGASGGW